MKKTREESNLGLWMVIGGLVVMALGRAAHSLPEILEHSESIANVLFVLTLPLIAGGTAFMQSAYRKIESQVQGASQTAL